MIGLLVFFFGLLVTLLCMGLSGFGGYMWWASIYEGGIRMPAIVRWPGQITPGSITGELAATYDIFMTVSLNLWSTCVLNG